MADRSITVTIDVRASALAQMEEVRQKHMEMFELPAALQYVKGVYDRHRAPGSPDWEEAEARVERRLRYLLIRSERVE